MFFRQKILRPSSHALFFFRKELFLILLICLSISSGIISDSHQVANRGEIGSSWKKRHIQEVKGVNDASEKNQFKEVEIVPAKYIKPVKSNPSTRVVEWGVAKQIDEYTWTMNVQEDQRMAEASEIIVALNSYRQAKGRGVLTFDQGLSDYAQGRASFFSSQGSMDSHAGFQDFISNQDGFSKLGFNSLGENSSFGYQLEATHLIEWVFAGDAPHDTNQLNPEWTHVGVGVSGLSVDLIFGGRKK